MRMTKQEVEGYQVYLTLWVQLVNASLLPNTTLIKRQPAPSQPTLPAPYDDVRCPHVTPPCLAG